MPSGLPLVAPTAACGHGTCSLPEGTNVATRHKCFATVATLLLFFPFTASSQPTPNVPQAADFEDEFLVFLVCAVLIVGWVIQLLMVRIKLKEIENSPEPKKSSFSTTMPYWFSPHRWAFVLIVIVLPVGLSFVSRILPFEAHEFLPALAFQFAASIFIIMITLEVTAIYNLTDNEWRPMLTTALDIMD